MTEHSLWRFSRALHRAINDRQPEGLEALIRKEKLAAQGLKYSRFHTTALCSPTRAALLSGRNHHTVGMGNITENATSAPGNSLATVTWPVTPLDPFFNANTVEDIAEADRLAALDGV